MKKGLALHAERTPGKIAYVMAGSGEVVSYGQLEARSNRFAQLLRAKGIGAGDHIAICMENHPRFLEICWGARRAGTYYTAISSHLTAPEVDYIVRDCGARLFLTSAARGEVAEALGQLLSDLEARLVVGGEMAGYERYEDAIARMPAGPIADEIEGVDMLYSSGTTGRPKGIKKTLDGVPFGTPDVTVGLLQGLYGFDEETVYLSPAPLYHAAPLRYNMSIQALGGSSIIMERFDAEEALALIERYRANASQWVPTMFVRMLKLPADVRARYDVSSMEKVIHAAAPCPVAIKEAIIEWFGPVVFEYYAGTEGNGFCAIDSAEWLAHRGSVGQAKLGVIHILDDAGNELGPGEIGGIYFSDGPDFEYHNDPERTAETRNAQGWATLGDVGYVDAEGYLYLTDRRAFTIISAGVNLYPQEIEDLLVSHPKVLDVAVIGVPNEEFGEEVKAVVQPIEISDAGPELERELMDYCRGRLSSLKIPRSIDFEASLPRHPTGKLYKRLLKDRYWGKQGTGIV